MKAKKQITIDNGLLYECERKSNGRVVHKLTNWIQQYKLAFEVYTTSGRLTRKTRLNLLGIFEKAEAALRGFVQTGELEQCVI